MMASQRTLVLLLAFTGAAVIQDVQAQRTEECNEDSCEISSLLQAQLKAVHRLEVSDDRQGVSYEFDGEIDDNANDIKKGNTRVPYPYAGLTESTLDMYPPFLVGATWGMNNCMGLSDTSNAYARSVGCVVTNTTPINGGCVFAGPEGSRVASTQMQYLTMVGNCRPGCVNAPMPLSAVAVKFSWQIDQSTLDWSDFSFLMSDGSNVQPWGINVAPDNDPEEAFTVTLFGAFGNTTWGYNDDWTTGGPVGPQMVSLYIVGELFLTNGTHSYDVNGQSFAGGNLDYTKGGVLTTAYVRKWGNGNGQNPISYGTDNCSAFPGTTHVLTAQTMGGTTYDGVNGFNPSRTELFEVTMKNNGKLRRSAYLGLADIDNDDFTDICLDITDGEYDQMDKLTMVCDPTNPCTNWALPHGNKDGFSPCTNTQPQVIAKPTCPGSVVCR